MRSAASNGHAAIVRALLKWPGNPFVDSDDCLSCVICTALSAGHVHIADMLVDDVDGSNLSAMTELSRSVLGESAQAELLKGNRGIVAKLKKFM